MIKDPYVNVNNSAFLIEKKKSKQQIIPFFIDKTNLRLWLLWSKQLPQFFD